MLGQDREELPGYNGHLLGCCVVRGGKEGDRVGSGEIYSPSADGNLSHNMLGISCCREYDNGECEKVQLSY